MFILEESELLEDNIQDPIILDLYRTLKQSEPNNERFPIIDKILSNEKCVKLIKLLLDFTETNNTPVDEPSDEKSRLTAQQREILFNEYDQKDLAPLALVVSGAFLQLFVIDNFTGPSSEDLLRQSYKDLPISFHTLKDQITFRSLSIDGSEVYHKVVNPWLLRMVQLCWTCLNSLGCSRRLLQLEFLVWKHRYLTVHLMILLEHAELLMNELRKVQEFIFDHHIINDKNDNNTQLVRFNTVELCCELVQSSLLRDGVTFCKKFFDYACEFSGISIEHTGVLGKKTKFIQKDIPQLVVKSSQKKENVDFDLPVENDYVLPKDIQLEDDTLLPDIAFVKEEGNTDSISKEQNIDPLAQILLLSKLDIMLKSDVMEESLKDEWTLAYLRTIANQATIWTVKYKALALRSVVEKKHTRKMGRALLQLEELIKTVDKNDEDQHKRLRSFYSVLPLSSWQMQRSLGDISMDLGLVKNALDVYLKIEYWEGIIKCYSAIGQTVKAQKVIEQELEKKETPYLYCLLGDVTDDIDYYERSWALSKGRFARAKKSIGTHHYVRKQYEEAISNYEMALSVNPSNMSILCMLAYCCLTTEKYERAAECYRNVTYLDDSSFLGWNNLSKAYIKLGQKERAWRTLREAIKCNYEEWKIWENFMVVSMDIGALDDVILAWHRIIDIKSSHKDDQILSNLTNSLVRRTFSKADDEYLKLLAEALKLVARLNSTSDCSPRLWICYFKLLIKEYAVLKYKSEQPDSPELSKFDIDSRVSKITNALQRSTPTTLIADPDWYREPVKIAKILDLYNELAEYYIFAIEVLGPRPELWRQWKYFKLSVGNIMKTLDQKGYALNQ